MEVEFTQHARDVMAERRLEPDWVLSVLDRPERTEPRPDGTLSYWGRIPQRDDRVLRVVVNAQTVPARVVTAFFDRRMRGKLP